MSSLKVLGCLPKFSNTGNLQEVVGVDVIIQSYFVILNTRRGQRVWQPEFGCSLKDQIFSLATLENLDFIREDIKYALTKWEPRASVVKIEMEYLSDKRILMIGITMNYNKRDYTQIFPFSSDIQSIDEFNIYSIKAAS
jgi:phage baseplate assembly protein W